MLRQRKVAVAEVIEVTKKLDAFYKLEDDYQETSSTRGTCEFNFYLSFLLSL
jgi:hypothetical protein